MPIINTSHTSRNRLKVFGAALFFAIFLLYVFIVIDPRTVYAGFGLLYFFPAFSFDLGFLSDHLSRPGGITEYISTLLSHGYYWSWLGSIILTLLAISLWAGMRAAIRLAGATGAAWIAYLLPILLLISYNACDHSLTAGLALSGAIWLALGAIKLAPRDAVMRTIFFLAVAVLGYWLIASGVLITLLLIWIIDTIALENDISGQRAMLLGFAVPWVMGRFLFNEAMPVQYLILSPMDVGLELWWIAVAMYLTPVLGVLIAIKWHKIAAKRRDSAADQPSSQPRYPWIVVSVQVAVLALVAVAGLTTITNIYERQFLRMAYYTRHGQWDDVLAQARALPADYHDWFTAYMVERALYHSGKLGEDTFAYPWKRQHGSMTVRKDAQSRCAYFLRAEMLMDLGDVNGAEWQAMESLENGGEMPHVLEMLTRLFVSKGCSQTARVYLAAMTRDPIAGARGRKLLQRFDDDPSLSTDPQVVRLRKFMPREDFITSGPEGDGADRSVLLLELLRQNPNNKMAAELLLAYYLENGRLNDFVQNFRRFDSMISNLLPRHYAEAMLLYAQLAKSPLNLGNHRLPEGVAERFERFNIALKAVFDRDLPAAKRSLAYEFGDTYWFHHTFFNVREAK